MGWIRHERNISCCSVRPIWSYRPYNISNLLYCSELRQTTKDFTQRLGGFNSNVSKTSAANSQYDRVTNEEIRARRGQFASQLLQKRRITWYGHALRTPGPPGDRLLKRTLYWKLNGRRRLKNTHVYTLFYCLPPTAGNTT